MKCSDPRLGLARRLLAVSVSFAVVISSSVFAFALPGKPLPKSVAPNSAQPDSAGRELQINSATATATKAGVLLQWSTNSTSDNLGFNLYRVTGGQRTRANREIIPGALFAPGTPAMLPGYSYSWFDRGGSADATYYIESVSVDGVAKLHQAVHPVAGKTPGEFEQAQATQNGAVTNATESTDMFEKQYPAEEARQPNFASGSLQQQWVIAGQTALKIAIKKDGWYRVTQPQMVAAGFNPAVDIRNLRLFANATEVAINTNQSSGQFGSGDYIEFYGQGLDLPTTDTRIYYLIADTTAGKRVGGEIHADSDPVLPPGPTATPPAVSQSPADSAGPMLRDPIFYSWVQNDIGILIDSLDPNTPPANSKTKKPEVRNAANPAPANPVPDQPALDYAQPTATELQPRAAGDSSNKSIALANAALAVVGSAPSVGAKHPSTALKAGSEPGKLRASKKRRGSKRRRSVRTEHNHALLSDGFAPVNFAYTTQIKERIVYFSNLLNGDDENFFGRVISSPVTQTLTVSNPDLTASTATLEFALQGVLNTQTGASHQVSVSLNGNPVGIVDFGPLEHPVRTLSIPMAWLQSGSNNLVFTKTSTGEVSLVDYLRLTYQHAFKADNGSLKFNLRGSQTLKVDGFSAPSVRLIDYTDPFNVSITKPIAETSASGYAITVPMSASRSKAQRLLYALPEGQFDQPASLSLNQPSTLNLNSNAADFLIISYRDFIPALAPLVTQRDRDGFTVKVVDVDDVYDEFSNGLHGPQAIKSFLEYAQTNWATPPRYVVFAGDASFDPRNYENLGNFDFVPTKLVDATYNETSSDDWLTDFDDDGVADIPIGRLPIRTVAETNLIISKTVGFSPANVPLNALLVADQDDQFHSFQFVEANDAIQAQLPGSMTVQRVNRGTPGSPSDSQIRLDILAGLNDGRAVVGYSGHGNVDVWTGVSILTASDARTLTNGNKLSFVVVMDCLNGYFQDPTLESMSEAFLKAQAGGAVAVFASSGLTVAQGQHVMSQELYHQLYGNPQTLPLGDAIKIAKTATSDPDVRRTWIFFGDPSIKIR
jgi:hypothetical protein